VDRNLFQREYYANSWIHSKNRSNRYNYDVGKFLLNLIVSGEKACDVTYCINTLWYVPDPKKAIDEFIRITKPGGTIVFDIMNQYHVKISRLHRRLIFENTTMLGKGQKIIKNIVKKVFFPKYGSPNWHYVVDQTPLYPDLICKIFPYDISLFTYNNSFIEINEKEPKNYKFEKYSRIIFLIENNK